MKFSLRLFFARNLDTLIDLADEYIFHGKLEKIIEVTYSYREIDTGLYLNETIFEDYLGLKFPDYSPEKLCLKYKFRIGIQILQIDSLIKKSKKILVFSRQQGLRKTLFIEALEYIKVVLEASQLGADFELEKASGTQVLGTHKSKDLINIIEKKEYFLFGEKIIKNNDDYSACMNYLYEVIQSKKNSKKFIHIADEANKYLQKITQTAKNLEPTKDNLPVKTKALKGKFLKKKLQRREYREIFDRVCEIYGLPQRTKITSASSIYDGDIHLEIPRNSSFNDLIFERILKLITHEIESHYINIYNNNLFIGNFRSAWNLPKEEGVAMFMEQIFHGYDIENYQNITHIFFPILGGECLGGNDYQNFMEIFGGKYKLRADYKMSLLRAKRNYSLHYPGVQHKDISYSRGLEQVVKYLHEGGEFYKLFLGKVGFHDLDNASILYSMSKQKKEAIFPLFFSDMIYYYLGNKYKDSGYIFDSSEFYLYLKKKYWFLGLERFEIVSRINANYRQIKSLLDLVFRKLNTK